MLGDIVVRFETLSSKNQKFLKSENAFTLDQKQAYHLRVQKSNRVAFNKLARGTLRVKNVIKMAFKRE